MNLKYQEKNGEKIAIIVLYGANRSNEVLNWQRKVMVGHFGLTVNYIECPFPGVSHGFCMNYIIKDTIDLPDAPDYYLFIDNDAIFLKDGCLDLLYDFVKNKMTVAGHSWQSNHKKGPNGLIPHAYASQATLIFSKQLYNALGRPDMDHWIERSDTAEELTYRAKEMGYIVVLIYPSHSVDANTDLDNGCRFGLGNTYGPNLMYHVSQQGDPRSAGLFIQKAKDVLDGKFK